MAEGGRVYSTNDPDEGMRLFGATVSANASNLAATTDLMIENLELEIRRLSELVMDIDRVMGEATVVDRVTDLKYRSMGGRINSAYRTHDRYSKRTGS